MKLQDNKITKNKKKFIDREKAKELTLKAAKILDDKKLEDIKVLDLDGITSLSDFFILATANSSPQMKAGADAVYKEFKKDEEINAKLEEMAKNYGKKVEEINDNENLKDYIKEGIESEKAIDFIVKNAKIK